MSRRGKQTSDGLADVDLSHVTEKKNKKNSERTTVPLYHVAFQHKPPQYRFKD